MNASRAARPLKGAAVTAVAVLVCHLVLSVGVAATRAREEADPDNAWAGTDVWLVTWALGLLLVMPLLLWAGMRVLRERKNHLLVIGCSLVWFLGAGYHLSSIEYTPGAHLPMLLLVGIVALGALLSVERADR